MEVALLAAQVQIAEHGDYLCWSEGGGGVPNTSVGQPASSARNFKISTFSATQVRQGTAQRKFRCLVGDVCHSDSGERRVRLGSRVAAVATNQQGTDTDSGAQRRIWDSTWPVFLGRDQGEKLMGSRSPNEFFLNPVAPRPGGCRWSIRGDWAVRFGQDQPS